MSCDTPVPEFARRMGVSDDTVRRWVHEGRIDAVRIGPRLLRVDPDTFQSQPVAQVGGAR